MQVWKEVQQMPEVAAHAWTVKVSSMKMSKEGAGQMVSNAFRVRGTPVRAQPTAAFVFARSQPASYNIARASCKPTKIIPKT